MGVSDDLLVQAALRALDASSPESVVAWASALVGQGVDLPGLVELAMLSPAASAAEVDAELGALLQAIGESFPSATASLELLAWRMAEDIVAARVDALQGARALIRLDHGAEPSALLDGFRAVLDEYESGHVGLELTARDVAHEARRLLAQRAG